MNSSKDHVAPIHNLKNPKFRAMLGYGFYESLDEDLKKDKCKLYLFYEFFHTDTMTRLKTNVPLYEDYHLTEYERGEIIFLIRLMSRSYI